MRSGILERRPGTWLRRGSRVSVPVLRALALLHVPCGAAWWAVGDLGGLSRVFGAATLLTALLLLLPVHLYDWLRPLVITDEGLARSGPGGFFVADEDVGGLVWAVRARRRLGFDLGRRFHLEVHAAAGIARVRGWLEAQDLLEDYVARILARRTRDLEARLASPEGLDVPGSGVRLTTAGARLEATAEELLWPELDLVGDAERLALLGPDGRTVLVIGALRADAAALREVLAAHWTALGAHEPRPVGRRGARTPARST